MEAFIDELPISHPNRYILLKICTNVVIIKIQTEKNLLFVEKFILLLREIINKVIYNHKFRVMTIFSKIVAGDIPSYRVAEDENYYAFLDINPLTEGHTLVIPKREVDYIFDLSADELAGLTMFAQKTAKAIARAISCKRVAMIVLGLEVPHAHIHLIPIETEKDADFGKERLHLSKEEFETIAKKISAQI
jgi:histidine triad (HIT) family protein